METITVSKMDLLKKLQENREEHQALFLKAQEGYREKIIELLDQRLADAREGKPVSMVFALPEPRDYTEAFDTAIAMVNWAQGATIEIDQHDFERYVLNKWEWRQAFVASTQQYIGGS